ncbi:ABC transporter permease [Candidatus Leptofilum sp.]|uniref:ABC transporter permease n=1 Tax=Candidatus Leptofilum sp. TaxID=3241576 RepID=UPI003B5B0EF0
MLKKIWVIFMRDIKVNLRDFISLYILLVPVIFAVGIRLLVPSVNDTTVDLALLEGDNPEMVTYLEQFANVELFADVDAVEERLERRDNIVAILPEGDDYFILTQGNEPESVVEFAKLLNSYHELDLEVENTTAVIETFGRTESPLKKLLVNIMILMTSVLAGMLISINIVEEKVDNTVSAINVSPISRVGFILGKSMSGMFLAIYGAVAILWITGFSDVNLGQIALAIVSVTLLSILVGFIEGINNDDVMNAAAGIKLLFLPLAAGVAAAELLSEQWQALAYWIPFYWTYKGNDAILSYSASWPQIISYTAIVLALCGAVYYFLAPKIQKGLA